jgi:parallel beta-helix repeat protein
MVRPPSASSVLPDPSPSARRSFYGQSGHWGSIMADNPTDSLIIRYADLRGGSFGRDGIAIFPPFPLTTVRCGSNMLRFRKAKRRSSQGGAALISGIRSFIHFRASTVLSASTIWMLRLLSIVFSGETVPSTPMASTSKALPMAWFGTTRYMVFSARIATALTFGIYSLNTLLEHNIIHDCSDKGISIGSQSNAIIRRNVIYDCDLGVALKDSLAVAQIDQNTFYGNRIAVACYEKSALRGGGKAFVKNTILSTPLESSIFFDVKSEIQVSYSLSDREPLPGTGNLQTDPMPWSTLRRAILNSRPLLPASTPATPFPPRTPTAAPPTWAPTIPTGRLWTDVAHQRIQLPPSFQPSHGRLGGVAQQYRPSHRTGRAGVWRRGYRSLFLAKTW